MELRDLIDEDWKTHEQRRFLKDSTKAKTDAFDPESFKHDGFDDREKYLETYVPALADEDRVWQELNDFTPPRLGSINNSPYQALVIRYGILRVLIEQPDYSMEKERLLEETQSWQQRIIDRYAQENFEGDDLLHLAKAAVDYGSDVDDSELHMIYSYFELHNEAQDQKREYYTWLDFFKRLAAIDRFPKVSRSEKPAHALDTIEKGMWSLQEQALVYEVADEVGDLVGIPEDYIDLVQDWLYYEMSDENYLTMLETLEPFDRQSTLIEARETFGVESKTHGYNQKRRESLVEAGVYPSELLDEVLTKDELKAIVDQYGLDAHKRKRDEMIEKTIEYFEQSQKYVESDEPDAELYLTCFEDISDGNVERIPPQLQDIVDEEADQSERLDMLFEKATATIFEETFNLDGTILKGHTASGIVADGEVEQDGRWLLWDNKRRKGKFRLGSDTQSKIKNYIDTKNKQHNVEWFVIIAPEFTSTAATNAIKLEKQVGLDIRLVTSENFKQLATFWDEEFAQDDRELPLSIFYGSKELDLDATKAALRQQFS